MCLQLLCIGLCGHTLSEIPQRCAIPYSCKVVYLTASIAVPCHACIGLVGRTPVYPRHRDLQANPTFLQVPMLSFTSPLSFILPPAYSTAPYRSPFNFVPTSNSLSMGPALPFAIPQPQPSHRIPGLGSIGVPLPVPTGTPRYTQNGVTHYSFTGNQMKEDSDPRFGFNPNHGFDTGSLPPGWALPSKVTSPVKPVEMAEGVVIRMSNSASDSQLGVESTAEAIQAQTDPATDAPAEGCDLSCAKSPSLARAISINPEDVESVSEYQVSTISTSACDTTAPYLSPSTLASEPLAQGFASERSSTKATCGSDDSDAATNAPAGDRAVHAVRLGEMIPMAARPQVTPPI